MEKWGAFKTKPWHTIIDLSLFDREAREERRRMRRRNPFYLPEIYQQVSEFMQINLYGI